MRVRVRARVQPQNLICGEYCVLLGSPSLLFGIFFDLFDISVVLIISCMFYCVL